MSLIGDNWDKFRKALASPSPESWDEIVKIGSWLWRSRETNVLFKAEAVTFLHALEANIRRWPPELSRKCPEYWPETWKRAAEYTIKEIQTYGFYEVGICSDKRLALADGTQGVRLERRFVGAARAMASERTMRVGQKGEPDLSGGMTIEVAADFRMEVTVGVEVKGPDGALRPEQKQRIAALKRRGGVAIVARTVEEAVLELLEERQKIRKRLLELIR